MEITILVICVFLLGISLINYFTAYRLDRENETAIKPGPFVSILIPARNEYNNLQRLIPSLLESDYADFEILVLDDESTDSTYEIALTLLQQARIAHKVFKGSSWNQNMGITGKNFACHQLAGQARGDILIFCDADVAVSKQAISRTVSIIKKHPTAAGISALPHQLPQGLLITQVLPWIMQIPLMVSLPLKFAWSWPFPSMQMANGQWLAIWKDKYDALGGHKFLGVSVIEDVALSKALVKESMGGLIPVLAPKDISVRMYTNWSLMREGFGKNLVLIYGGNSLAFLAILMVLNTLFFYPIWAVVSGTQSGWICLFILTMIRFLSSVSFGNSKYSSFENILMMFPSLVLFNVFSFQVLKDYLFRPSHWKGRLIPKPGNSL